MEDHGVDEKRTGALGSLGGVEWGVMVARGGARVVRGGSYKCVRHVRHGEITAFLHTLQPFHIFLRVR